MASITARGAASVDAMGGFGMGNSGSHSLSEPAGWHLTWWAISVFIIAVLLWML